MLARGSRQRHVSAMNGVEGAAKKADIHAPLVSSFPALIGKSNVMGMTGSHLEPAKARARAQTDCPVVHRLFGPEPTANQHCSPRIWNELQ
jgi:hypothetical protein